MPQQKLLLLPPMKGLNLYDNPFTMSEEFAVELVNFMPPTTILKVRPAVEQISELSGVIKGFYSYATGAVKDLGLHWYDQTISYGQRSVLILKLAQHNGQSVIYAFNPLNKQNEVISTINETDYTNDFAAFKHSLFILPGTPHSPMYIWSSEFGFREMAWVNAASSYTLAITDLENITFFNGYLYANSRNTFDIYYMPIANADPRNATNWGQITNFFNPPYAGKLSIDGFAAKGGSILKMFSFTRSGLDSLSDFLCICTTEGELILFKGTNPDDDKGGWTVAGRFSIPVPLNKNAFCKMEGDIVVATKNGLFSLNRIIFGQSNQVTASLETRILNLFDDYMFKMDAFASQIKLWYNNNNRLLILNVPYAMPISLTSLSEGYVFRKGQFITLPSDKSGDISHQFYTQCINFLKKYLYPAGLNYEIYFAFNDSENYDKGDGIHLRFTTPHVNVQEGINEYPVTTTLEFFIIKEGIKTNFISLMKFTSPNFCAAPIDLSVKVDPSTPLIFNPDLLKEGKNKLKDYYAFVFDNDKDYVVTTIAPKVSSFASDLPLISLEYATEDHQFKLYSQLEYQQQVTSQEFAPYPEKNLHSLFSENTFGAGKFWCHFIENHLNVEIPDLLKLDFNAYHKNMPAGNPVPTNFVSQMFAALMTFMKDEKKHVPPDSDYYYSLTYNLKNQETDVIHSVKVSMSFNVHSYEKDLSPQCDGTFKIKWELDGKPMFSSYNAQEQFDLRYKTTFRGEVVTILIETWLRWWAWDRSWNETAMTIADNKLIDLSSNNYIVESAYTEYSSTSTSTIDASIRDFCPVVLSIKSLSDLKTITSSCGYLLSSCVFKQGIIPPPVFESSLYNAIEGASIKNIRTLVFDPNAVSVAQTLSSDILTVKDSIVSLTYGVQGKLYNWIKNIKNNSASMDDFLKQYVSPIGNAFDFCSTSLALLANLPSYDKTSAFSFDLEYKLKSSQGKSCTVFVSVSVACPLSFVPSQVTYNIITRVILNTMEICRTKFVVHQNENSILSCSPDDNFCSYTDSPIEVFSFNDALDVDVSVELASASLLVTGYCATDPILKKLEDIFCGQGSSHEYHIDNAKLPYVQFGSGLILCGLGFESIEGSFRSRSYRKNRNLREFIPDTTVHNSNFDLKLVPPLDGVNIISPFRSTQYVFDSLYGTWAQWQDVNILDGVQHQAEFYFIVPSDYDDSSIGSFCYNKSFLCKFNNEFNGDFNDTPISVSYKTSPSSFNSPQLKIVNSVKTYGTSSTFWGLQANALAITIFSDFKENPTQYYQHSHYSADTLLSKLGIKNYKDFVLLSHKDLFKKLDFHQRRLFNRLYMAESSIIDNVQMGILTKPATRIALKMEMNISQHNIIIYGYELYFNLLSKV